MKNREQFRREQIMRAAEQLFTSKRFHEITTADIAAKAGIGKGTIYRYFKDKEDLFHQTALHGFEELCRLLEADEQVPGPLAPRLLRALMLIDTFFQSRRRLFGLMQAEENRLAALKRGRLLTNWRERRQRLVSILAVLLREGIRRGELRDDLEPERLAALLLGMLKGLAHEGGNEQAGVNAGAILDLFLNGAVRREVVVA